MQGGPIALGLGVVVAGGLFAALVVTGRSHEAAVALAAREAAEAEAVDGEGGDDGFAPTPDDAPVATPGEPSLAAALTRMADALDRIEKTLARLEARGGPDAQAETRMDSNSERAAEPWFRRPNAILDWLPPEGVTLAKAWYQAQLEGELSAVARGEPPEEAHVAAREEWIREVASREGYPTALAWARGGSPDQVRAGKHAVPRVKLARLAPVQTEIDLARWLDETRTEPPKRWQLAEFAATRAGK